MNGRPDRPWIMPAFLGLYALILLGVGLSFSGTYDAGDSVMHFLFAHHAMDHPEIILDHWAKPAFTFVSMPFASLGMGGMKLFNALMGLITAYLVYRSAVRLGFRLRLLGPLLLVAAPEFFLAQFSGLTEPMFACLLILGIYLLLRGNFLPAVALLSFLPFVRTEGFLLLPVFALYLIWHRRYPLVPLLALGTVVISLIGWWGQYETLTWVFTENPYASDLANYGKGSWGHFPRQYLFVLGLPIYALFWLGWIPWGWVVPQANVRALTAERILLVYLPFCVYFGAHMVFWATGIGHSLGMLRVLIAIQPLAALIALAGLTGLARLIPARLSRIRTGFIALVMVYVALFPVLPNPAAIQREDLDLSVDQRLLSEMRDWYLTQDLRDRPHYTDHPSTNWLLERDPFDSLNTRKMIRMVEETPPAGSIVIWDSWFAVMEGGVAGSICSDPGYRLLWEANDNWKGKPVKVCVVEKL